MPRPVAAVRIGEVVESFAPLIALSRKPSPRKMIVINNRRLERRMRELGIKRFPEIIVDNFSDPGFYNWRDHSIGISPEAIRDRVAGGSIEAVNQSLRFVLAHEVRHVFQESIRKYRWVRRCRAVVSYLATYGSMAFGMLWWIGQDWGEPWLQIGGSLFCGLVLYASVPLIIQLIHRALFRPWLPEETDANAFARLVSNSKGWQNVIRLSPLGEEVLVRRRSPALFTSLSAAARLLIRPQHTNPRIK